MVGTTLLITTLVLAQALTRAGGFYVIEHPAPCQQHDELCAASIWRLEAVHRLAAHPDASFVVAEQDRFGAQSAKPTGLLSCRLPHLCKALNEIGTESVPQFRSIGADANGVFYTAALKEYPPKFCRAIASSMLEAVEPLTWSDRIGSVAASYEQMVMPHDVYWEMGEGFWG